MTLVLRLKNIPKLIVLALLIVSNILQFAHSLACIQLHYLLKRKKHVIWTRFFLHQCIGPYSLQSIVQRCKLEKLDIAHAIINVLRMKGIVTLIISVKEDKNVDQTLVHIILALIPTQIVVACQL